MVAGQVQEALVLCRRCCSLRLTRQACTLCVRWWHHSSIMSILAFTADSWCRWQYLAAGLLGGTTGDSQTVHEQQQQYKGDHWPCAHWNGHTQVQCCTVHCTTVTVKGAFCFFLITSLLIIPSLLRHPNIALLMAVSCGPTGSDFCLLLEPLHTYSLHHWLYQYNRHSVLAKMNIIIGVATGEMRVVLSDVLLLVQLTFGVGCIFS